MSEPEKSGGQIIIGNTRESRCGNRVVDWFYGLAAEREGMIAGQIYLRNWPLPLFDVEAAKLSTTNADKEYGDV